MKRNVYLALLLSLFMILPSYGATPDIYINGLLYKPTDTTPILLVKDTPYLAIDDLAHMVHASITSDSHTSYAITLSNRSFNLTPNSYTLKENSKVHILKHPILLKNNTLYVPLELLDIVDYDYHWDAKTMTLNIKETKPFSTNSNDPNDHTYKPASYHLSKLPAYINLLSNTEDLDSKIETAIKNNDYIGFINNKHQDLIVSALKEKLGESPYNNISLLIRDLRFEGSKPIISSFTQIPIEFKINGSDLSLLIGEETYEVKNYWTAFSPKVFTNAFNVDASVDMTLMQTFYEWYRDTYDLRDDLYYCPIQIVSNTRTNTLKEQVYYLDMDETITHYETQIFRVHPSGKLIYIIDLLQK